MLKEWFEELAIHLKGIPIVRIFNFHCSVWINHLNDERGQSNESGAFQEIDATGSCTTVISNWARKFSWQ